MLEEILSDRSFCLEDQDIMNATFSTTLAAVVSIGVAASFFGAASEGRATTIDLGFPSSTSIQGGPSGGGALGTGGGGIHFTTGDSLTQTFTGTGLSSAISSEWQFSMSNFTSPGVDNSFDVLINGNLVGSFDF
jgi:hypothetical protein